ncbi:hypothetical protein T492DRAFT_846557 [Pavlovales sp. CCMP2436]|nr:hypothetical protein T492DRAFT_846557 [Pavlovales sp. CCMP2436]
MDALFAAVEIAAACVSVAPRLPDSVTVLPDSVAAAVGSFAVCAHPLLQASKPRQPGRETAVRTRVELTAEPISTQPAAIVPAEIPECTPAECLAPSRTLPDSLLPLPDSSRTLPDSRTPPDSLSPPPDSRPLLVSKLLAAPARIPLAPILPRPSPHSARLSPEKARTMFSAQLKEHASYCQLQVARLAMVDAEQNEVFYSFFYF